jgi:hypothetical protein
MSILKSAWRYIRFRLSSLSVLGAATLTGVCGHLALAGATTQPSFTSALDDSPLTVKRLPNEVVTEAVEKFYATGNDPYDGDPATLADGRTLDERWCQSCHMSDGSGRMGPSFIGETHHYPRFKTD